MQKIQEIKNNKIKTNKILPKMILITNYSKYILNNYKNQRNKINNKNKRLFRKNKEKK